MTSSLAVACCSDYLSHARTAKFQERELFRYTDKLRESVTGLYYSMARWYDPQVGRFVGEDSYGGSLKDPLSQNRYIYARDDPMTLVDPTGKVYTDEQAYGDTNACTTADCSLTQAQMDANDEAMVGATMYDPVEGTSKVSGKSADVTLMQQGVDQHKSTATIGTGAGDSARLSISGPSPSSPNLLAAWAVVAAIALTGGVVGELGLAFIPETGGLSAVAGTYGFQAFEADAFNAAVYNLQAGSYASPSGAWNHSGIPSQLNSAGNSIDSFFSDAWNELGGLKF